jgi:hypothetical protein
MVWDFEVLYSLWRGGKISCHTCWDTIIIIYGFTSRSRIFHLNEDVTITGEGLQNVRRSGPLNREGYLSCHTCSDTGPLFFRSLPKDRPIQSPLTTHEGMWRTYSNPDPHGDSWDTRTWVLESHQKKTPFIFLKSQSLHACDLFTPYIRPWIHRRKSARLIVKVVGDRKTKINRIKVDDHINSSHTELLKQTGCSTSFWWCSRWPSFDRMRLMMVRLPITDPQ